MGPSPHVAVRVAERAPSGTVYDASVYGPMLCVPLTLRVCAPVSVPDRPALTRSPVQAEDCTVPFRVIAPSLAVDVKVIVTTEPTSYKVVVGERESPTLARVRVGLLVGNNCNKFPHAFRTTNFKLPHDVTAAAKTIKEKLRQTTHVAFDVVQAHHLTAINASERPVVIRSTTIHPDNELRFVRFRGFSRALTARGHRRARETRRTARDSRAGWVLVFSGGAPRTSGLSLIGPTDNGPVTFYVCVEDPQTLYDSESPGHGGNEKPPHPNHPSARSRDICVAI